MLYGLSPLHIAALACVVLVLFGRKGKISDIMGDIGGGFRELKKGLFAADEVKEDLGKFKVEAEEQLRAISRKASAPIEAVRLTKDIEHND